MTSTTAFWTILSSRAAMPSGRVPPSGLGIETLRDGSARYAPECTRSCRASNRSSNPSSYSLPHHAIHASRGGLLQVEEGAAQRVRRDVVQERSQFLPRLSRRSLPYPLNRLGHAVPTLCFGACFGLANSPWLRPFPPATPQAFVRPCSPPSTVVRPHPTSSFRASSVSESPFLCGPGSTAGAE